MSHWHTCLKFYNLFHHWLSKFTDVCSFAHILIEEFRNVFIGDTISDTETNDNLSRITNEVSLFFNKIVGFADKFKTFKKKMNPIQTFQIHNVKQFETMFIFIQAKIDININLHLKLL